MVLKLENNPERACRTDCWPTHPELLVQWVRVELKDLHCYRFPGAVAVAPGFEQTCCSEFMHHAQNTVCRPSEREASIPTSVKQ